MTSEIIVGVLSLIGTLCGTFTGIITSTKLTNYRIEQLEKKVEKHNSVVERTAVIEDNLKSQCDIIIDGYFDEQKIDNNRALVGSLNQNINYISNRYTNEKDWFYKKKNLIEEINVGSYIFFNGDKI